MHNTMIRCNPSLSLSFTPSYLFDNTFEQTPLLISQPKCTCCCCCCCCCCCYYNAANSSLSNRLSTLNHSSLFNQLPFSRRVMFYGNSIGSSSLNVFDKSYYYKKNGDVKERRKYEEKGLRCNRKKQYMSSIANVDDVEVMLSLLTGEEGLECIDVGDRKKVTKKRICGEEVANVRSFMNSENLDSRNEGSCGELEGREDFEVKCGGYLGQTSSNVYMNDLGENHNVRVHEIVDNIGKPPECVEKKDTATGNYGDLVSVSQDYRNKSEKKMNEEFSQHKSNVYLNVSEECGQHTQFTHEVDKFSVDSGSEMKYNRFADKGKSVTELNTSTETKLKVISEVSKSQEIGKRGTPSLSESRIKSFEEKSTEVKDQVKDGREEHLKRYEQPQKIIGISDTHFSNKNAEGDAEVTKTSIDGNDSVPGMISVDQGSRPKGGGSRHSSQGSGLKGPSDEMWHVTDASTSTQDPSEPDTQDNMSDIIENGELAKASGRSLWTIIGDVVRLNWKSPRSESHTPNSRGAKGSSYMSASSENWFSSHDPDDSNDEHVKKQITKGLDSPLTDGPSKRISLPIIKESPFPLPATQMTRSPATNKTKSSGELKRRRLEPKNQVTKHNFDECEEAYGIEAKQRKIDEMFMTEALLEAKKAADVLEVPVGAVLVKDGKIIARGYNLVEELRDSTAHAEMICIRKASTNLRSWRLMDTTLYVTLEPCPMCAGAILQARIDTVVWGAPNKLLGADGSWVRLFCDGDGGNGSQSTDKPPAPQHPFHPNMVVRRGVLAAECAEIMQNFFRLRRSKKQEPEPEPVTPPSSITVSHHRDQSNFFSKVQHAFKIIFCL